jgi:hypothetical protein
MIVPFLGSPPSFGTGAERSGSINVLLNAVICSFGIDTNPRAEGLP